MKLRDKSERWIITDDYRCLCPDCGKSSFRYPYCPWCGVKNRFDDSTDVQIRRGEKMSVRPIDKTKKSNIKCEHCKYWCSMSSVCRCKTSKWYTHFRYYYCRCREFVWREDK